MFITLRCNPSTVMYRKLKWRYTRACKFTSVWGCRVERNILSFPRKYRKNTVFHSIPEAVLLVPGCVLGSADMLAPTCAQYSKPAGDLKDPEVDQI